MADPMCVLNGISRRIETNSPAFANSLTAIEMAATHPQPILLTGEIGTGKKYLARLIHEISFRRFEPFLHVACGSLSQDSVDAALFGTASSSSKSGHAANAGAMKAVRRGTLVLDEVGSLRKEPQERLARLLATHPDQSENTPLIKRWPARLIVISDVDLELLVEDGRFGSDFYQTLQRFRFEVPPLRRRVEDIDLLAAKFIRQLSVKFDIPVHDVDSGLFSALKKYVWPGNVLELQSVIERTVLKCRDGRLNATHLPKHIVSDVREQGPCDIAGDAPGLSGVEMNAESAPIHQVEVRQFNEKEIIEQTLFQNCFNGHQGAGLPEVSRVALYSKMKKYGLQN